MPIDTDRLKNALIRPHDGEPGADVRRYIKRIEADDSDIRAFVPGTIDRGQLISKAASHTDQCSDQMEGAELFGTPVGVKDIIHVDGFETRGGSLFPPEVLDGEEATVIERLREAGALMMGKTATTEFALKCPAITRNPHDLNHTPGGSSSGSAAAVAAGFCPLALGTQTGGSTIRPASFCGVVGFKPSLGRIPTDGILPISPTLDHVGLFTQDATGMEKAAAVMCDSWSPADDTDELPTFGVPQGEYLDLVSEAGTRTFERSLEILERVGCEITRVNELDDISYIQKQRRNLADGELAMFHESLFDEYRDFYRTATAEYIENGRSVTVHELATARTQIETIRSRLERRMEEEDIDVWVTPASVGPAPQGLTNTGDPVMNEPWTFTGLPSITLPLTRTEDGLPVGTQIVGKYMTDEQLLSVSKEIESRLSAL